MVFQFGQYKIDVDIERTKSFYENAMRVSENCSCDGCLNFERAVDALDMAVVKFFAELGVDIKRVCECYACCTNKDGTLTYGGFTHVCGTLLEGDSAWQNINEDHLYLEEAAMFSLTPDFQVSFQEEIDLIEEDFPRPVIQLEFAANIPWVIDKKNTY